MKMSSYYKNVGYLSKCWCTIDILALYYNVCSRLGTIKCGNVVTFFVRNHIFLESFLGDLMLYVAKKLNFKKAQILAWTFLAFFQNLDPFLRKNVGMMTLPTCCVKSALPYIQV
jgi:hypothetical protein